MTDDPATDRLGSARPAAWPLALLLLVGTLLSISAWSLATPLMAAPDEPAQMTDAAAVVRGQLDVPTHHFPVGPDSIVKVPLWVAATAPLANCVAFKPSQPASCQHRIPTGTRTVDGITQFSNYPPLYYAITGLPSLFLAGRAGVWSMRFAGVILDGALVALGLFLLARYHPSRAVLAGALLALTPSALFLSGVLNSSGLEISAGFATWCGGLCLIAGRLRPRALVYATSVAAVLLVLARPASPAYLAVIAATLALLGGWRRVTDMARAADLRALWVAAAAAVAVAGVLLVVDGSPHLLGGPPDHPYSTLSAMSATFDRTWTRMRQAIGVFGWNDTLAPHATIVIWLILLAAVVAAGLVMVPGVRRSLSFLAAAVLIMPLALEDPQINAVGLVWQGRYWLPLLVGLPLLASSWSRPRLRHGAGSGTGHRTTAMAATVVVIGAALLGAQIAAFLRALRRYQVGLGPGPHVAPHWSPPGGAGLLVSLLVAGQVVLISTLAWQAAGVARGVPAATPVAPTVDPATAVP